MTSAWQGQNRGQSGRAKNRVDLTGPETGSVWQVAKRKCLAKYRIRILAGPKIRLGVGSVIRTSITQSTRTSKGSKNCTQFKPESVISQWEEQSNAEFPSWCRFEEGQRKTTSMLRRILARLTEAKNRFPVRSWMFSVSWVPTALGTTISPASESIRPRSAGLAGQNIGFQTQG